MPPHPVAEPVIVADLWSLAARPERLAAAAAVWRAVAADARAGRATLDRATATALAGTAWAGDAADTYHWHRAKLGRSLDEVGRLGDGTAAAYDAIAALLRRGQALLDDAWQRLAVPVSRGDGTVTFRPADAGQADLVRRAVAEAGAIRADVEHGLAAQVAALRAVRPGWATVARDWADVAAGRVGGWLPPAESPAGLDVLLTAGGDFVVNTGSGNDVVEIRTDPADGSRIVTVGGFPVRVPAGARLVVRTGAGRDVIRVVDDGREPVTVLAGTGDDQLFGGAGDDTLLAGAGTDAVLAGDGDDRVSLGPAASRGPAERAFLNGGADRLWGSGGAAEVSGGDGDDLLFGGAGDDRLAGGAGADTALGGDGLDHVTGNAGDDALFGGTGRDYVDGGAGDDLVDGGRGDDTGYGLSGSDVVLGGPGDDYLEGGAGDDVLDGGAGRDVLSGGRGDDKLDGGAGDDVLYSGAGADVVHGGAGTDELFGQPDDRADGVERLVAVPLSDLGGFIQVDGDAEFVDRVEADLDLLRASPAGQQMLAGLQDGREQTAHWGYPGDGLVIRQALDDNGHASRNVAWPHQHPAIGYNPAYDGLGPSGAPPVVVLFHEAAHVYDYTHGTANQRRYNGASGSDLMPDGRPVLNLERQAVGLPIDDDGDPRTANRIDPRHPLELTENGLRAEMHLPSRVTYGDP